MEITQMEVQEQKHTKMRKREDSLRNLNDCGKHIYVQTMGVPEGE